MYGRYCRKKFPVKLCAFYWGEFASRHLSRPPSLAVYALILPLLVACITTSPEGKAPAYKASNRLPLDVCLIEGIEEPLLCGELEVYENRRTQLGRKITLKVVVVPAQQQPSANSAWIEHPGGPRYSNLKSARYFAEGGYLESFRRDRDIVLTDARGLHGSGGLFCDALRRPRILERYYPPERVRQCREQLATKADLTQYSTLNAIADYESIRQWLGYEKWDVGGWSFGSRFMLTYLHRYPDSIRTVTLIVPATLNFDRPLQYARFGQQAFDGLVEDCRAEPSCNDAFPTVAQDLTSAMNALRRQPQQVRFVDPNTGEEATRVVTKDLFAEAIWVALLSTANARQLPFVLRRAASGDLAPFVAMVVPTKPEDPEPEGHYFAVVCPEETGRLESDRISAAVAGTFAGDYIVRDYVEACEAWGQSLHPEHPITPERFSVPALIVTSDRDPVTPPAYGEVNAQYFDRALHLTLKQIAHRMDGVENRECMTVLIDEFVRRASVEDLDVSCINSMKPPAFRLQ